MYVPGVCDAGGARTCFMALTPGGFLIIDDDAALARRLGAVACVALDLFSPPFIARRVPWRFLASHCGMVRCLVAALSLHHLMPRAWARCAVRHVCARAILTATRGGWAPPPATCAVSQWWCMASGSRRDPMPLRSPPLKAPTPLGELMTMTQTARQRVWLHWCLCNL